MLGIVRNSGTEESSNISAAGIYFTHMGFDTYYIFFSFEMNFNKTGFPSSNTSYKIDTYAKRWRELCGRFPSSSVPFGSTIPSNTNPKDFSSVPTHPNRNPKRWRELCGRFLSSPVPFGSTIPGGTGELRNWGTEARSTIGTELLRRSAEHPQNTRTYTHIKRAIHHDEGSVQG